MTGWLLKSIGIDGDLASGLGQASWLWARPVLLWVGLVLLVPLGVLIVWRHRRSLGHVSPWLRALLTACRVAVLALLVVVLAGPYVKLDQTIKRKPVLAVIVDDSLSMTLPAGPFEPAMERRMAAAAGLLAPQAADAPPSAQDRPLDPQTRRTLDTLTRLGLVKKVLTRLAPMWKDLDDKYELRAYRTAAKVRPASMADLLESRPDSAGDETDLGQAIQRAIDDASDKKIAGIVLISDGRWTTGPDPMAVLQHAGSLNATPLWTVPPGSAIPLVDAAVADVLAPRRVTLGDTVTVTAEIESQGLDGRAVRVRLLGDKGKILDESAPLTLKGQERQEVGLSFHASEPGPASLTVSMDELPEDQVRANNQRRVVVRVDAERLKVLYLEGYPRWDFRFLDHALRRDQGLETTMVVEAQLAAAVPPAAGATPDLAAMARLPMTAEALGEYHTVILGDVSPALLPRKFQKALAAAVREKGLGLIVQGGPFHMPVDYPEDSPIMGLLPVKMDPAAPAGLMAPNFAPFHVAVTAEGAIHPILRLYDEPTRNRQVWSHMPEFYWAGPALDTTPGATVLAEFSSGQGAQAGRPLIAEQYAGRGRVLYLGTDATYRWRRNVGDTLFYRFWGQAIRDVARDKGHSGQDSWMEVHPERVEPGEQVGVELYAVDDRGQPVAQGVISLAITGGDAADHLDLLAGAEPGRYRGLWEPKAAGTYKLSYADARGKEVSESVEVAATGREMRRPIVDREALGAMADAAGGGMLELYELGGLPKKLKAEATVIHLPHQREVWDNWITLVLLIGLYCTDVGIRRIMGLT